MRITKSILVEYGRRYDRGYRQEHREVEIATKRVLDGQRYLRRADLITIGRWKSPRAIHHYESLENDENTVQEVTTFSFSTKSERARILSLLVLKGVSWPMASTILHFAFPDRYPIMDFRVIESLTGRRESPTYTYDFWQEYCAKVRRLAVRYILPIWEVEKALWQYSKESPKRDPA